MHTPPFFLSVGAGTQESKGQENGRAPLAVHPRTSCAWELGSQMARCFRDRPVFSKGAENLLTLCRVEETPGCQDRNLGYCNGHDHVSGALTTATVSLKEGTKGRQGAGGGAMARQLTWARCSAYWCDWGSRKPSAEQFQSGDVLATVTDLRLALLGPALRGRGRASPPDGDSCWPRRTWSQRWVMGHQDLPR